jgi:hypothetical protein
MHAALVEWHWHGKLFGETPVLVPVCPSQIWHQLALDRRRDFAVSWNWPALNLKVCVQRAVNTFLLGYKTQSVDAAWWNNRRLFWHPCRKQVNLSSMSSLSENAALLFHCSISVAWKVSSIASRLTHCGRVRQICVFNTVKLGTSASSPWCHSTRGNVSRGITSSSTTRVFGEYYLKISVHKNS